MWSVLVERQTLGCLWKQCQCNCRKALFSGTCLAHLAEEACSGGHWTQQNMSVSLPALGISGMNSSLVCIFEQSCQCVYLNADHHGVAVGAWSSFGDFLWGVASSSQHKYDLWPLFSGWVFQRWWFYVRFFVDW